MANAPLPKCPYASATMLPCGQVQALPAPQVPFFSLLSFPYLIPSFTNVMWSAIIGPPASLPLRLSVHTFHHRTLCLRFRRGSLYCPPVGRSTLVLYSPYSPCSLFLSAPHRPACHRH